jgi:succinate-acetate transporter protein
LILRWFSGDISTVAGALAFGDAFGSWLLLWGVFTVLLSVGAWYINMPAFLAFALLALAYFVLGFANIMNPSDTVTLLTKIGGWVLIIDGICAWYLAWAAALNSLVPNKLPLWPYPYSQAEATAPTSTPAVHA